MTPVRAYIDDKRLGCGWYVVVPYRQTKRTVSILHPATLAAIRVDADQLRRSTEMPERRKAVARQIRHTATRKRKHGLRYNKAAVKAALRALETAEGEAAS